MERIMFQIYVNGIEEALDFYKNAFKADVNSIIKLPDTETIVYAELKFQDLILAIAENQEKAISGNTMQICLHLGVGKTTEVNELYTNLKVGATILSPLGKCNFSHNMADIIDKFGVHWCIFE